MVDQNEEQSQLEETQVEDLPADETEAGEVKGGVTVLAWARVDGQDLTTK